MSLTYLENKDNDYVYPDDIVGRNKLNGGKGVKQQLGSSQMSQNQKPQKTKK